MHFGRVLKAQLFLFVSVFACFPPGRPPPKGNVLFQVALWPPFACNLGTRFNRALRCSAARLIKPSGCCRSGGNADVVCPVISHMMAISTVLLSVLSKPCWRRVFPQLVWVVMTSQTFFFFFFLIERRPSLIHIALSL